jgi:uncharacterized membrane protein
MDTSAEAMPAARAAGRSGSRVNVGGVERWASVIAGSGLLAYALARRGGRRPVLALMGASLLYRGATGCCPVHSAIGRNSTAAPAPEAPFGATGIQVRERVTIDAPIDEVYRLWRRLENLPGLMRHVESVEVLDAGRSRWTVAGPAGVRLSWEAEITDDVPGEIIAWRSRQGGDVVSAGTVAFRETRDRLTTITVALRYAPAAGMPGAPVARALGPDPARQIREDLQALKRRLENGRWDAPPGGEAGRRTRAEIV